MKCFIYTAFSLLLLLPLSQARAGESVTYYDGDTVLEGYWEPSACDQADTAPVIMIAHQWMGLTGYEKMRAAMLAEKCYNAFAIDMYGRGNMPASQSEASRQSALYKNDPALARRRIGAALAYVRHRAPAARIAAIGYCFGGTMVLELARSGAAIDAVASFHGGLSSSMPVTEPGAIRTAIAVFHGADDPHVPPDEVERFRKEMETAQADLRFTAYEGAVHAFTQKDSGSDPSGGVAYNERADRLSWEALLDFLEKKTANPQ